MVTRNILLFINPHAGIKKYSSIQKKIETALQHEKLNYQVLHTTPDFNVAFSPALKKNINLCTTVRDNKITDIFIIGGDGTLFLALNSLKDFIDAKNSESDAPTLSFIPCGSGNDFVKNFPYKKDIDEAIKTAIHGNKTKIDIGAANDRFFFNTFGIGFDGETIASMLKKKYLSGHAAYQVSVLGQIVRYKTRPLSFRVDGKPYSGKILMLAVCNGTTIGGGFTFAPNAKIDDGILDICIIFDLGIIKRVFAFLLCQLGLTLKMPASLFLTGKEIIIDNSDVTPAAQTDGELISPAPFIIKILPKKIEVRT